MRGFMVLVYRKASKSHRHLNIISLIQMSKIVLLSLLIIITFQVTQFRLSTNEVVRLNVGDALISTLGYFKATLQQTGCTLVISNFKGSSYTNVGNYTSPGVSGNCRSLTIIDGQVVTQSNTTYMQVGWGYNLSTILTIDDLGVIRLIGTYRQPNYVDQVSQQLTISDFSREQTYIYSSSQMTVTFMNMFNTITNNRNWQFSAAAGELTISQNDNNGIYTSYSYAGFTINNSQIVDFNGNTFPAAIFPNITYQPRCLQPRLYLDFKPPFVFVADPNWPVFTLYEQGRYKVLEISLSSVLEYQAWQEPKRLQTRNPHSVCPPYTFEFQGDCVTTCPSPYYHEMRGINGYCVLTCEQYTPKNDTTRICSCFSDYEAQALILPAICPNTSISYPYGCYCNTTGRFFDRLLTLSCVATCPETTFASNGLCMQCPNDCKTCQIDKIYRSYLECKTCMSGFTLTNGNCYKTCSPGLGLSIVRGTCEACNDTNCLNCSQNVNICTKCSLLFALSGGVCLPKCPDGTTITYDNRFSASCLSTELSCVEAFRISFQGEAGLKCITCNQGEYMHLGKCVAACPGGYVTNADKSCFCANSSLITINDQCLPLVTCPIEMGWDPLSNSCFSCNFGCLTCYNSACTSCNPGYFLYISPQGVRCRRKSPLYPCDQQYGWVQNTCLVLTYQDPNLGLTDCYANIKNCKACSPVRDDICILCNPGFINHNNTCIKTCPNGTELYNGLTCILLQIEKCQKPYLSIFAQQFVLSYNLVSDSSSYQFYTFNGRQSPNDPVGNIPVYQQLIQRKNDGTFRISEFYHPTWTCLLCNDGLGMSADFTQCLPCPDNCVTCYMALNTSCIIAKGGNTTVRPVDPVDVSGCRQYVDKATNKCVQNCSTSTSVPQFIGNILYCTQTDSSTAQKYARIDSAIYVNPDGSKNVFFVIDQSIKSASSINLNVMKKSSLPLLSADGDSTSVSANTQTAPLQSGSFVNVYDPTPTNSLYVLDLSNQIKNLVTDNNLAFPNTAYGAAAMQSHPEFMKTWLAYIGYIMGITLILLHVVFIGNDLLYKVDNALILGQTIYFFSFVQLLVGKLLAQFYYGWSFTHFAFFPNFFSSSVPNNYVELAAPNSYKLATLDANIIRNAGFAFSLLLVFVGAYALVTLVCLAIANLLRKPDVWHPKIAVGALVGGLQFISMSIFYWSVGNLLYISGADTLSRDFYYTSISVSIFFIVIISVYTLVRWFFHPIGGLYMGKRILLATILAAGYQNDAMLAPLLILQTVFTILRYCMEVPERKREKYYLALEYMIYMGIYLLLWLCLDAGINTIVISVLMFIIIVSLAHDLTEVYLESRNEWEVEDQQDQGSSGMAKAEAEEANGNSEVYKGA